jgi:hypothetical protein
MVKALRDPRVQAGLIRFVPFISFAFGNPRLGNDFRLFPSIATLLAGTRVVPNLASVPCIDHERHAQCEAILNNPLPLTIFST